MGGEIGLMLGASILSFFEIIDLLFFLIYNLLLHTHKCEDKAECSSILAHHMDPPFEPGVGHGGSSGQKNSNNIRNELKDRGILDNWPTEVSYDEFGDRVTTL